MGARFWVGYSIGYGLLVVAYSIFWALRPTDDRATAGLSETGGLPPRFGWVIAILIIPTLLSASRLSKIKDRGSVAHAVIPILLAFAIFVAAYISGFLPDEIGCGMFDIERFGPLDPECTTASSVRVAALVEATILWAIFGLASIALRSARARIDARRRRRMLETGSSGSADRP